MFTENLDNTSSSRALARKKPKPAAPLRPISYIAKLCKCCTGNPVPLNSEVIIYQKRWTEDKKKVQCRCAAFRVLSSRFETQHGGVSKLFRYVSAPQGGRAVPSRAVVRGAGPRTQQPRGTRGPPWDGCNYLTMRTEPGLRASMKEKVPSAKPSSTMRARIASSSSPGVVSL